MRERGEGVGTTSDGVRRGETGAPGRAACAAIQAGGLGKTYSAPRFTHTGFSPILTGVPHPTSPILVFPTPFHPYLKSCLQVRHLCLGLSQRAVKEVSLVQQSLGG